MLALREDSDLESWQRPVVYPPHSFLGLAADTLGGLLKRLEARDQNVSEEQQTLPPRIVFAEAAEDPRCDELAESRSTVVDILAVTQMRLFVEKLSSVDQQAVY